LALDSASNPVFGAIKAIKSKFGDSVEVACDVCLCTYTSHGHCGIFRLVASFNYNLFVQFTKSDFE
jgi:delta-aminolevulinic acid dehydratase/porphobilinogen synthase